MQERGMKKKLQIFVSSTYEDMLAERQSTVEAILKAGHIPAGMELFNAGDKTQLEIIKRWIEDSDIFVLILGGRYGTLEPKTKKSYIELEYIYAKKLKKPHFAIVIREEALLEKIKKYGGKFQEQVNISQYKAFRRLVLNKMSHLYKDVKDIQLSIFQNIRQYENANLSGWISGKEVQETEKVLKENIELRKSSDIIQNRLNKILQAVGAGNKNYEGYSYAQIKQFLKNKKVTIKNIKTNVFDLFISFSENLNIGVANSRYNNELEVFLFYNVIPTLLSYGLAEKVTAPASVQWSRARTSKTGHKYIAESNSKISHSSEYKNKNLKNAIVGILSEKEKLKKDGTYAVKQKGSILQTSDNASTRIDRISSIMGLKRKNIISDDIKISAPRRSFDLYSTTEKDKYYVIAIHDYRFDVNSDLADIRVMIEQWKMERERFEFVVATNNNLEAEKNRIEKVFKGMLKQVVANKFRLSIWDNTKLLKLEKKYHLR